MNNEPHTILINPTAKGAQNGKCGVECGGGLLHTPRFKPACRAARWVCGVDFPVSTHKEDKNKYCIKNSFTSPRIYSGAGRNYPANPAACIKPEKFARGCLKKYPATNPALLDSFFTGQDGQKDEHHE
jgi:hypothetical protein